MGKLYRKHNYSPFDSPILVSGFVQLPIFGILYRTRNALTSSSTFLWIRNLAIPNLTLTIVIRTLTTSPAYLMPSASPNARAAIVVIQLILEARRGARSLLGVFESGRHFSNPLAAVPWGARETGLTGQPAFESGQPRVSSAVAPRVGDSSRRTR